MKLISIQSFFFRFDHLSHFSSSFALCIFFDSNWMDSFEWKCFIQKKEKSKIFKLFHLIFPTEINNDLLKLFEHYDRRTKQMKGNLNLMTDSKPTDSSNIYVDQLSATYIRIDWEIWAAKQTIACGWKQHFVQCWTAYVLDTVHMTFDIINMIF